MARGTTITVFAGISGLDKRGVVDSIADHSRWRGEVHRVDFEEELLGRPPLDCPDMPSFLDIRSRQQKLDAVAGAFRRIAKDVEGRNGASHVFLTMHLSYFKNSEFFPPLMPSLFSPMLDKLGGARMNIVTLIDDAFAIRGRLARRDGGTHSGTALRLREILIWRSQEALCAEGLKIHMGNMTETAAGKEPVRSYMVSVNHPHATFENLIFGDRPRRACLSYPVSSTRDLPDDVLEINEFRKEAHAVGDETGTAVFDPVTVDELALRTAFERSSEGGDVVLEEQDRWPLGGINPVSGGPRWPVRIPRSEVAEVLLPAGPDRGQGTGGGAGDIGNQISSRDYRLVEDANLLAAYRPMFNMKKSAGVDAEIRHAKKFGKKVVVYHPPRDGLGDPASSPFGSDVVAKADRSEFVGYLRKALAGS